MRAKTVRWDLAFIPPNILNHIMLEMPVIYGHLEKALESSHLFIYGISTDSVCVAKFFIMIEKTAVDTA